MRRDSEKFKANVTALESQDDFRRSVHRQPRTGQRELPPGYYLTSYTQLTGNGVPRSPRMIPATSSG